MLQKTAQAGDACTPCKLSTCDLWLRIGLSLLAAVVFCMTVCYTSYETMIPNYLWTALIFSGVYLTALLPFVCDRKLKLGPMTVAALLTAALIFARVCLLHYESNDYRAFLSDWLGQMRQLTAGEVMRTPIGDYNMPYLYLLLGISRTPLDSLMLIKTISCVFDVLAAFFVMKCVGLRTQRFALRLAAYALTLALPTVLLNGAYWGQCDSMFAALCLGMLYFILRAKQNDGKWACILWAAAFSFKLQAIFALPLLIVALFVKRVKLHHLLWLPAVFFAGLLPALICGRHFLDCIGIYFSQASQYPYMSLNLPSIWSLLGVVEFEPFNLFAIFLAGAAVLTFLYLCWEYRHGFDQKTLLLAFFLGALLIPYLLPRMHDRYFYLADLAALAVFLDCPKKWYVPLITVLSSYSVYRAYSMGIMLFEMETWAVALLVLLTVLLKEFFTTLKQKHQAVTATTEQTDV